MSFNIPSNHNLKFSYTRADRPQEWNVFADGKFIGTANKVAASAYEGHDIGGRRVTYLCGPGARGYTAESLAHYAGLLDENYNLLGGK